MLDTKSKEYLEKRNKIIDDLMAMPVGDRIEVKGENTTTRNGVYSALHNKMRWLNHPHKYKAVTFDGSLLITKIA